MYTIINDVSVEGKPLLEILLEEIYFITDTVMDMVTDTLVAVRAKRKEEADKYFQYYRNGRGSVNTKRFQELKNSSVRNI